MKFILLAAVFSLFLLSPVFASGNLSVASASIAPAYINTRTVTNMLNLTMNSTVGNTNITSLNVTIAGNVTIANVSGVFLINATGSTIASSTANSTTSKFTVSIPAGFNASSGANTSFIVAVNISALANPSSNVSLQLESSAAFGVDSSSNVTFSNFMNSTDSEIRNLHANASISPTTVDTNVINQTFVYTITSTGPGIINSTILSIPSAYQPVEIREITLNGTSCLLTACIQRAMNSTHIYVNFTSTINNSVNNPIAITFTANTSSSQSSGNFTSTITGSNVNSIATEYIENQTNVLTKQIFNATVSIAKGAAIVNGTDYWEFNFTLGFNANVAGLIQFKMNNWADNSGQSLAIKNTTTYFATLRNESNFNTTAKFNVNTTYTDNWGINKTSVSGPLILRMLIPTSSVISNSWSTAYSFVFRATP